MQFNNRNNNSRDAVNINTRAYQFMNAEGFYPSTLQVGFWNDMISLKINPALEKSQQTDNKRFNYDQNISTAITLDKVVTLLEKVEKDIIPAYGKEEMFRGVTVSGNSLVGVGMKKLPDGRFGSFLAIFKGLDDVTKKPSESIYYEFKTAYTVNDYDPETGNFTTEQDIPNELILFTNVMKSAVTLLTNAGVHASKHAENWLRTKVTNQLNEIGGKLGIAPPSRGAGNYNIFNRSNDVFGSSSNTNTNTQSSSNDLEDAPMEKVTDFDSIDAFMQGA